MGHGHDHDDELEYSEIGEMDVRVRALESILTEKGLIDPPALDRIIETYQTQVGPRYGARVVAKAWTDPEFADWLQRDATAAIAAIHAARRTRRTSGEGRSWTRRGAERSR